MHRSFLGHVVLAHCFRELEYQYTIPPNMLDVRWAQRFIQENLKIRAGMTIGHDSLTIVMSVGVGMSVQKVTTFVQDSN